MSYDNWIPPLVQIPLTKGYFAFVDLIDSDLAEINWYTDTKGYARAYSTEDGKPIALRLHRVVMERVLGRKLSSREFVDHIDHNPANNSRANLRVASPSQNQHNRRLNRNSTSGYKGVSWHKTKKAWVAVINVNGKNKTLGRYKTAVEAAHVYNQAALKYFGEFAHLNVIEE